MNLTDLPDMTIAELAPLLRRRELSPVELTSAVLDRIGRLDPVLKTYITVLPEEALREAEAAERAIAAGDYLGPLHGIPIAHKDVILTRGVRTTAHSRVLQHHVPTEDATVVARLRAAGTVLLGKLNTYEFACGATELFGVPVNPWDTRRITAGSSAGSGSGVSAGLCLGATGTDTGGSVRSPASFCGVVGLKPSYGRVSRAGVLALSWSLDHVGPLGRCVRDVAMLLGAMAGFDAADPGSSREPVPDYLASLGGPEGEAPDVRGMRVGVPEDLFGADLDPEVERAFAAARTTFGDLGVELVEVTLPEARLTAAAQKGVMLPEATAAHLHWLRADPRAYAASTRRKLLLGACLSGADYLHAQRLRQRVRLGFDDAMQGLDAMIWPTSTRPAGRVDEPQVPAGLQTRLTNLTGTPSLSLPCGFTADGLPLALQVNGHAFDEVTVLRLADAFERATPYHRARPTVGQSAGLEKAAASIFAEAPIELSPGERGVLERHVSWSLARAGIALLPGDLDALVDDLALLEGGLEHGPEPAHGGDRLRAPDQRQHGPEPRPHDVEPAVHQAPFRMWPDHDAD